MKRVSLEHGRLACWGDFGVNGTRGRCFGAATAFWDRPLGSSAVGQRAHPC